MQETIVCKFGGSSLANAEQIRRVADIVKADERRRLVVVSAPGKDIGHPYKITDLLYNLYFRTHSSGSDGVKYQEIEGSANELMGRIGGVYSGIASGLGLPDSAASQCMGELERLVADPRATHHDIASRGENFNARLIAQFLDAEFADAADLIRITDKNADGGADGDNEDTMRRVAELRNSKRIVVIPGFYGIYAPTGEIRTYKRGGSDLTGSIISAGVGASLYENWTDQPGVRCCDPRIFPPEEAPGIPVIRHMTYREARELTYMGFEVFNDKAIGPARRRQIPVNIRYTQNPLEDGTLISAAAHEGNGLVRGIAGRNGFCRVDVEKFLLGEEVGFGSRLLGIFAGRGLSYEHAPSGIDNISVILEQRQIDGIEGEIVGEINEKLHPDKVDVMKGLALVAVVGEGMKHTIGVAATITRCLADSGVNIEILNQGASESNIIIGVRDTDYKKAVVALYHALIRDSPYKGEVRR